MTRLNIKISLDNIVMLSLLIAAIGCIALSNDYTPLLIPGILFLAIGNLFKGIKFYHQREKFHSYYHFALFAFAFSFSIFLAILFIKQYF